MICYKDMTFCPFYEDCSKKDTCHRPLTEEVRYKAQAANLPIAQYTSKPECHKPVKLKEDKG